MLPFSIIRAHWRLLAFGFGMAFFSSFGQTFFISLFSGELRTEFSLTHGEFGSLYAIATLSSAAVLVFAGRLIDHWRLVFFSGIVLAGLAAAALSMAVIAGTAALAATIFGLRLFGQGLTSHASITTMARHFDAERGRALSLASLGHAGGEAFLPPLVVAALSITAWRNIWLLAAVLLLLIAIPLVCWLLKGHQDPQLTDANEHQRNRSSDFTLGQTLRDPGLYLRLPAILATPSIGTGLVFHQVHLASAKGWPLSLMAGSFSLYAAGAVFLSLATGVLVDKITARRLMPFFLFALICTCIVAAEVDALWGPPIFFGLLGIASGIHATIQGTIWAELYGVTHLGSIRAFAQAAMVFATGIAPAIMGILIDMDVTMSAIAWGSAAICVVASMLTTIAKPHRIYMPE